MLSLAETLELWLQISKSGILAMDAAPMISPFLSTTWLG